MTQVTDARSNATQYEYDAFERLTKEAPPGGASYATAYQYNALDLLVTRTAPGSVVTAYVYDTSRRLTKLDLPSPETDHSYQYDVMSQLTRGSDGVKGHALSGSDVVDDWLFAYDADGALTKERLEGNVSGESDYFPLGERQVQFDPPYGGPGRRTKQAFKSENRTGYLNLDTYQTYAYDASKFWLTRIQRESDAGQKASYFGSSG